MYNSLIDMCAKAFIPKFKDKINRKLKKGRRLMISILSVIHVPFFILLQMLIVQNLYILSV